MGGEDNLGPGLNPGKVKNTATFTGEAKQRYRFFGVVIYPACATSHSFVGWAGFIGPTL